MIRKTILLAVLACVGLSAQARERLCFDKGWRFILADTAAMATPEYHDAFWRQLDVPHDWAIEGDFYVGNPSGAGGGALPGGIGWYRKTFEVGSEDAKSEKFFLEFDGVYMNATVYVNGQKVGYLNTISRPISMQERISLLSESITLISPIPAGILVVASTAMYGSRRPILFM